MNVPYFSRSFGEKYVLQELGGVSLWLNFLTTVVHTGSATTFQPNLVAKDLKIQSLVGTDGYGDIFLMTPVATLGFNLSGISKYDTPPKIAPGSIGAEYLFRVDQLLEDKLELPTGWTEGTGGSPRSLQEKKDLPTGWTEGYFAARYEGIHPFMNVHYFSRSKDDKYNKGPDSGARTNTAVYGGGRETPGVKGWWTQTNRWKQQKLEQTPFEWGAIVQ